MPLFCVKMRAAEGKRHISGAERIVDERRVTEVAKALIDRAMTHSLGKPDFINLKMERLDPARILHIPALPVTEAPQSSVLAAFAAMERLLVAEGLKKDLVSQTVEGLKKLRPLRGALLYDLATNREVTPDPARGIRVTYMDAADSISSGGKHHFREAIVLATKVANAPGMLAEICISDDPDYVTGYYASRRAGYVRLTPLKDLGDSHGGRIFLCDTRLAPLEMTIEYLEKTIVLVENIPK